MSAGLRGAARVRRVRRVECGGEREWVWRLVVWSLDQREKRKIKIRGIRLLEGEGLRENVFGLAMFGVDERFGLRVAVHGDAASAVKRRLTGLSEGTGCAAYGGRDDYRPRHAVVDQWTLLASSMWVRLCLIVVAKTGNVSLNAD